MHAQGAFRQSQRFGGPIASICADIYLRTRSASLRITSPRVVMPATRVMTAGCCCAGEIVRSYRRAMCKNPGRDP